jgi:hypothetical protein
MKKDTNSVDDFFRKSLQDHKVTPSEAARSRFLDEAAPAATGIWHSIFRWQNMLAAAVILSASVILYFGFFNDDVAPAPAPTATETQTSAVSSDNSAPEINTPTPNKIETQSNSEVPRTITQTKSPYKFIDEKKTKGNATSEEEHISEKSGTFSNSVFESTVVAKEEIALHEKKVLPSGISSTAAGVNETDYQDGNHPLDAVEAQPDSIFNLKDTTKFEKDFTDLPGQPDQGQPLPQLPQSHTPFGFTPFLLYSLDWNPKNDGNSLVHSLGLEGKITYCRFSLTSGLGVTYSTDYSNYEVGYNDYLGSYQKLDSITFAYDQKRYNLVPTYYMSDSKVWDSVLKLDTYQEEVRYNQLRIPVMAGYTIIQRGKFVVGLKTGVEMLFYLKSNTVAEYEYNSGQNKLVGINQLPDSYAHNNFWFMANISAAYNVSKRIVFEIEPHVKYLLNPDKTSASPAQQEIIPALRSSIKLKF